MSDLFRERLHDLDTRAENKIVGVVEKRELRRQFLIKFEEVLSAVNQILLDSKGSIATEFGIAVVLSWSTLTDAEEQLDHSIRVTFKTVTNQHQSPSFELKFGNNKIASRAISELTWQTELEDLILSALSNNLPTVIK